MDQLRIYDIKHNLQYYKENANKETTQDLLICIIVLFNDHSRNKENSF